MPRTKAPKEKPSKKAEKVDQQLADTVKRCIEKAREDFNSSLDAQLCQFIEKFTMFRKTEEMKIPKSWFEKTLEEVQTMDISEPSNILGLSTVSMLSTTTAKTQKKRNLKRTSSFDEGYTTNESSNSGGRASRSRMKTNKTRVSSRSLSRTRASSVTKSTMKTPANRQPPRIGIDIVTPKVKPNTPQVLIRRPKLGEMALSFQGSPVLTGPLVCDDRPNVNIPLPDGNLLTLESERGLRVSQIPDFDDETRRRLEILKDNLLKLCSK